MQHNFTVLIVDDEEELGSSLSKILSVKGYRAVYTVDPFKVLEILQKQHIDLLILDIRMPGLGGIDLLKIVKSEYRDIPIIIITGYPSIDDAVQAMKYGALNFFTKPLNISDLLKDIEHVANSQKKLSNSAHSDSQPEILTKNPEMMTRLDNLRKAAPTEAPVILTGESGTGKELAACALHRLSKRYDRPFIKVNCAAIPDNLLESDLFGHKKGAFTDAHYNREGKFGRADGGTIFLDEIGDMSIKTQAKILRVLQEKEYEPLGGSDVRRSDARVIAATNKDLKVLIEEGVFREDLYYRLSVITIDLIPLRKRREDLMLLADFFLSYYTRVYGKQLTGFSEEVKKIFLSYNWPGNVRELRNCVERAIIFCEAGIIGIKDLSPQYQEILNDNSINDFQELYSSLSREMIHEALEKSNGSKQKAAQLLKVHRKTLYNKMKKLGMK